VDLGHRDVLLYRKRTTMSFVTAVIAFVALLFFALTYVISTSHGAPLWLAFITFVLGICLVYLAFLSFRFDLSDKLEDFTDGR
jgi:uncharacterized membrane protein